MKAGKLKNIIGLKQTRISLRGRNKVFTGLQLDHTDIAQAFTVAIQMQVHDFRNAKSKSKEKAIRYQTGWSNHL